MEPEHAREDLAPRDRVAVHVVWEALLLVGAGVAGALVWSRSHTALSGDELRGQLVLATAAVLLASAFAVSLRAAAPNLAIGAMATAAGVSLAYLVTERGMRLPVACVLVAVAALGTGLVLGALVAALRAPAWAVSLGAAGLLLAGSLSLASGRTLALSNAPDVQRWAWPLFGAAVAMSVVGGVVALVPSVRAGLSRYRANGDPAAPRGGYAALAVLGALALSALLAAAAGAVLAFRQRAGTATDVVAPLSTLAAVAAALLGGVSAHGRRGGLVGTVLAACGLQLLLLWMTLGGAAASTQLAVVSGAALVGLLVTRLVERLGAPPPADETMGLPIMDDDAYPRYAEQT